MNIYLIDLGWAGGVVVQAESPQKAIELIKQQSYHGDDKEISESNLIVLKPNEVYTFMGDS
jgi:hypothetical protein